MALLVFDDIGQVGQIIRFGAQTNGAQQAISVGVNLPAGAWHTVIAEVPGSILFEVKSGPFNPKQAKEYATWAPEEDAPEAAEYLMELKRRVSFTIECNCS
jgi:cupin fold WbuC family metalloprotein